MGYGRGCLFAIGEGFGKGTVAPPVRFNFFSQNAYLVNRRAILSAKLLLRCMLMFSKRKCSFYYEHATDENVFK